MECRLEHTAITSSNIARTIQWYCNNFGFEKRREYEKPDLRLKGAIITLHDAALEILEPYGLSQKALHNAGENGLVDLLQQRGINHIALKVDDIHKAFKRLIESDAEFVTDLVDSRYFFCRDPDGILIEVRQGA